MSSGLETIRVKDDGQVDLVIDQTDSFNVIVTFYTDSTMATASNLTGYSGEAEIRTKFNDSSPLATFTVSIPSPTTGQVQLSLTKAQTATLTTTIQSRFVDIGFWDLHLTSGSGGKTRYVQGTVVLNRAASY